MYETETADVIKRRILARLDGESISTREGSFADTVIGPVAVELSNALGALDAFFALAFPDADSGGVLDLMGDRYGLVRKAGTKARATITLSGTAGVTIPTGTSFLTADGREYILTSAVTIPQSGQGEGALEAVEVGDGYNADAGDILRVYANVDGLKGFDCGAATGGVDAESDGNYFARIESHLQRPASSGNAYYYEELALEVPGVAYATATPREYGPGTVGIMVADADKQPVEESVLTALQSKIEEERLICDGACCYSVTTLEVTVTVQAVTDGSVSDQDIKTALVSKLDTYLKSIPLTGNGRTVTYHQVAYQLLSIPGVTDYVLLTLNGGVENVQIPAKASPHLQSVEVTVA